MFTKKELDVLKKFENGAIIETTEERDILYRFAAVSFVRLGHENKENNFKETAKLSSMGKRFLWQANLRQSGSKTKKIFYKLLNSIS